MAELKNEDIEKALKDLVLQGFTIKKVEKYGKKYKVVMKRIYDEKVYMYNPKTRKASKVVNPPKHKSFNSI